MPTYKIYWEECRAIGYMAEIEANTESEARLAVINNKDSVRTETQEMEYDEPLKDWPDFIKITNVECKTPQQGAWGEDSTFSAKEWRDEVVSGNTRLGYWDWVMAQRADE